MVVFFFNGKWKENSSAALVPAPCWHVPPGKAGVWSSRGSRESFGSDHPQGGPDGTVPAGGEGDPAPGREPRARLLTPPASRGHLPRSLTDALRSTQGRCYLLRPRRRPAGGRGGSTVLPSLTLSALQRETAGPGGEPEAELPLRRSALARSHTTPRKTSSPSWWDGASNVPVYAHARQNIKFHLQNGLHTFVTSKLPGSSSTSQVQYKRWCPHHCPHWFIPYISQLWNVTLAGQWCIPHGRVLPHVPCVDTPIHT